jgi:hypothetical protein
LANHPKRGISGLLPFRPREAIKCAVVRKHIIAIAIPATERDGPPARDSHG